MPVSVSYLCVQISQHQIELSPFLHRFYKRSFSGVVPSVAAGWNLDFPLRELKVRVSLMLSSRAFINSNDLIVSQSAD